MLSHFLFTPRSGWHMCYDSDHVNSLTPRSPPSSPYWSVNKRLHVP